MMKENIFTQKILDIVVPMEQDDNGDQSFHDIFIVTDHQPQTLSNIFSLVKPGSFTLDHALTIIYNLICGINFLHSAKVSHGSLQPENVLISSECNVLLSDFSRAMTTQLNTASNLVIQKRIHSFNIGHQNLEKLLIMQQQGDKANL